MTLRVADHALLRYLERTGRIDIRALRADISARAERCVRAADAIGLAGTYVVRIDGVRLVVDRDSETAVTTLPERRLPARGRHG